MNFVKGCLSYFPPQGQMLNSIQMIVYIQLLLCTTLGLVANPQPFKFRSMTVSNFSLHNCRLILKRCQVWLIHLLPVTGRQQFIMFRQILWKLEIWAEYKDYNSLGTRHKNLKDSQLQSALGKKRWLLSITFEIRQNVLSPGRKCHANAGDDNILNKCGLAWKDSFSHVFEPSCLLLLCVFLYLWMQRPVPATIAGPANAYYTI